MHMLSYTYTQAHTWMTMPFPRVAWLSTCLILAWTCCKSNDRILSLIAWEDVTEVEKKKNMYNS